jgi:hypothetical protein
MLELCEMKKFSKRLFSVGGPKTPRNKPSIMIFRNHRGYIEAQLRAAKSELVWTPRTIE